MSVNLEQVAILSSYETDRSQGRERQLKTLTHEETNMSIERHVVEISISTSKRDEAGCQLMVVKSQNSGEILRGS